MPVNDKQVQKLIDKAIARYKGKYKGRKFAVVRELASSLGDIIDERKGKCHNYEYAAADHYLNMRAYVALTGQFGVLTAVPLILVYDFAKVIDMAQRALTGWYLVPRTDGDPCPPTDASTGVMSWALKGVADGMDDFNRTMGIVRIPRML